MHITGDVKSYEEASVPVLIETAKFWLSRAVKNEDGSFSIPDAGGPDEFHVVGNDSAYVNNLAAFTTRKAVAAVEHLRANNPHRLAEILKDGDIPENDLEQFADLANGIRTMQDESGLFEQCRGYFKLRDEVVHSHGGDVFETQTVKQADVIMMLMLLPDEWDESVWRVNWEYYEPRCVHLSSLSHGAHGLVAAELGIADKAEDYLRQSMGMDLGDEMANAGAGAHMAANGMNWVAVVRGFGGSRPCGDRFQVNPKLPTTWSALEFRLKWRGADFMVRAERGRVMVENLATAQAALPVTLCGQEFDLEPGSSVVVEEGC